MHPFVSYVPLAGFAIVTAAALASSPKLRSCGLWSSFAATVAGLFAAGYGLSHYFVSRLSGSAAPGFLSGPDGWVAIAGLVAAITGLVRAWKAGNGLRASTFVSVGLSLALFGAVGCLFGNGTFQWSLAIAGLVIAGTAVGTAAMKE